MTLEHEYILTLRKGGRRSFADPADRARRRESAYFWEERNSWFSDVWDPRGARQALGDAVARRRSAAFPFEIAWRLVLMHSVRGDTVLDPFLGTGTTILATMAAGRNSIGVEIDPALAAIARDAAATAADAANEVLLARLEAHRRFAAHARTGGTAPRATYNRPHGFPVMTAQEEDLLIELVDRVELRGDARIGVSYRVVPS